MKSLTPPTALSAAVWMVRTETPSATQRRRERWSGDARVSALRPEKMGGWYVRMAVVEGCERASSQTAVETVSERGGQCGGKRGRSEGEGRDGRSMQVRTRRFEPCCGSLGRGASTMTPTLSHADSASERGVKWSTADLR